jgi:hypothetical protein
MKIDWVVVLRDVLIVLVVSGLGLFMVNAALSGGGSEGALTIVRIVLMGVGFCISGCLVKQTRFRHLGIVAIGVWFGTALNLIGTDRTLAHWILGLIPILLAMLLGGAVSLAIVRKPPAAPTPQE